MKLTDFHYEIPEELIASEPMEVRGTSRLLVLNHETGEINDRHYADVVNYLQPGDVLVMNDTKVIKARLITKKATSGARELILIEKHGAHDDWHRHKVLYRKKLHAGDSLTIGSDTLHVEEILDGGIAIIRSERDLLDIAQQHGSVPLPPYMHRDATEKDIETYQTVFAKHQGSVAAPTASLNMTPDILKKLEEKGVILAYVTLHVGLGTFLPIRVDDVTTHKMHQEYFEVPASTAAIIWAAKQEGRRVVALGTTVTRTLEYAHGEIMKNHGETITGEADIFIYPGYVFKTINGMLTNFHAPESTVLMLTAAFAGWDSLKLAYEHAGTEKYRFFSYGDSMLII
ncbi:MAG: tRNA preQ1(34) S-adenosylmethionine ribosyltransferase-isomerase QueA [Candidatus Saccharimonadales bacterium]